MKNKRIVITAILLSGFLVATTIPTSIVISRVSSAGSPRTLSSDITPTTPGKGETVSFLPDTISQYWQMEDLLHTYKEKANAIGKLTPYGDDLMSWQYHMGSSASDLTYRRAIYEKYDIAFQPTNNLLAWNSKINAKNYRVIISQDKSFSTIEREYVVDGSERSVKFINPYTGTDYYWQVIATKNDDSLVYSDIFNFTVANLPRTMWIEGVSNTRDIGGNVGFNGKKIKQGLIYRGMRLEDATSTGEAEIKNQLGIKTEIDLRNVGEGVSNFLNLTNYYSCPSPYVIGNIDNTCIDYFGSDSLVPTFGNAIKALANKNNYPVYFHCAVGRDRTGWLSLCLNLLCGVSEEVALKEFCLSLFSVSGAYYKGTTAFYDRVLSIYNYLNGYDGVNMSEKVENYLVSKAGVTSQECEAVRKILLGDIDTGFVPGTVNTDPYTDLARVTFRRNGQTPIIKLVEIGSLLDRPNISGDGEWYHNDTLWGFDHDVVTEDMFLDFLSNDKYKVTVHYSGINQPDDVFDVAYEYNFDFSVFDRDGYTFKVYDDSFNRLDSLVVTGDILINVVYSSTSGYIPKSNSRIVIMAGQSNGAGVAHYEFLNNSLDEAKLAEINAGYSNVLITGYSHGDDFSDEFRVVKADRSTMTAGTPATFGFEIGLADRLSKAFPDETTYIVKYAYGGSSLNHDWISKSGRDIEVEPNLVNDYPRGWLYDGLEDALTKAIARISETTNTIPMIETFMWMQGESDADSDLTTDLYQMSFELLLDDLTSTFKDNISYKFAVYDAAISETSIWKNAKRMNYIKRSRVDEHNVYIETNDRLTTLFEPFGYNYTDPAHYDAACYIDLGHMFADAYLSKTLKGYTYNKLEIESVEPITLHMGQDYSITAPTVYMNNEVVMGAKLSYFAEQHRNINNEAYSFFVVNDDNSFTPVRVGKTQLRITAYYNNEVRTILVPVEVVS